MLVVIPTAHQPFLVDVSQTVKRLKIDFGGSEGDPWLCTVGAFSKQNDLYFGTSKGAMCQVSFEERQVGCFLLIFLTIVDQSYLEDIADIQLRRQGNRLWHAVVSSKHSILVNNSLMLVNATDRAVRVYDISKIQSDKGPELLYKLHDLINRIQWSAVCFSPNCEFIAGSSTSNHNISIWDRHSGQLVKILEGPKEPVDDFSWHPVLPIILSVSSYGLIYFWTKTLTQNWSAFAPGFVELEGNVEYTEREDEFDKVPGDEDQTKREREEQDTLVDVVTLGEDPLSHLIAGNTYCASVPVTLADLQKVSEVGNLQATPMMSIPNSAPKKRTVAKTKVKKREVDRYEEDDDGDVYID